MRRELITRRSRQLSLVAIFASLNIVCDSIAGIPQFSSGVWYSWVFMTEPVTGIVLTPYAGFLSTLIGVMAGHIIYPRGTLEFLFTIGAPMGTAISGLMFRRKYKIVCVYFAVLFAAYFATPVSWELPIWGMWDTYCAFAALLILTLLSFGRDSRMHELKMLPVFLALCAFIGLEADILFRIFLFIPCQLYKSLLFTMEDLKVIWTVAAFVTPVQVALSTLFSSTIGVPLIKNLRKMSLLPED